MAQIQIDPKTGERVQSAPQIDPATGERMSPLPGVPKPPAPAGLQANAPAPFPTVSKLAAVSPSGNMKLGTLGDTIGNVGTHLKNMATGIVSAVTPETTGEKAIKAFGPGALPAYKAFVKPSVDAIWDAVSLYRGGGPQSSIINGSTYDAQGNNVPTAGSKLVDAIPVVGPWARNAENDTAKLGYAPMLSGLATDIFAPKAVGRAVPSVIKAAGKGAQLASATLESVKMAATRAMVPGKPGELLQSALKPGVKYGANVASNLETALPDVIAADPALRGVSGFAKASDTAADMAYQPYNNLMSQYRPPVGGIGPLPIRAGASIYGGPIADAQNASIPAINRFESPTRVGPASDWTATRPNAVNGIVQNTADRASLYDRNIPASTADAIREDANAKLNAFYAKTGGDQNAALSNPETARIKAIGDSTRSTLYPFVEKGNGLQPGTIAAMQQKFGNLSETADIANKREPVFARHDPVSLSQKIVSGHGNPLSMAWNYGVQKMMTNVTNSDALVNSAIDRFQNPTGTPLNPRAGFVPQMGSAIGRSLYGTGSAMRGVSAFRNPLLYSAAANPPRR